MNVAFRRPHSGMKMAAALPIVIPAPEPESRDRGRGSPGSLQGSLRRRSAGGVGPLGQGDIYVDGAAVA